MTSIALAAALGLMAAGLAPTAVAAKAEDGVITLQVNQPAFWDGEATHGQVAVPSSAACGDPDSEGPCWDYPIRVAKDGADRLRVSLEAILPHLGDVRAYPDLPPAATEMIFGLELHAPPTAEVPEGELVAQSSTQGPDSSFTSAYTAEVFAMNPVAVNGGCG